MTRVTSLFIFCLALLCGQIQAQPTDCTSDRYQERVFNNIQVTSDLTYGNAQNVVFWNQSLELDFYEPAPAEEYLQKRPLVVMIFGGAYILGSKTDPDMVAWCDSLSHRGYVCASIEYRLDNAANFALFNQGVRAAYRAIQDGRAAIRYLLEDPDNLGFNIDPDHIYIGGQSAGAITAINVAHLEEAERPVATTNYNIFNPDLGCLDCSGNNYVQPFEVAGIIDLWGAVLDPNHIDAYDDIPMVLIHGDADNVVPYDSGPPFNVPLFPTMYGAVPMDAQLTANGTCHQFFPYPGEGHTIYGTTSTIISFPNNNWEPIYNQGVNFLYDKTMAFDSPVPMGNQVICPGLTETYTVPMTIGSIYCWSATNGTILSQNNNQVTVQWNQGMGSLSLTETTCIDIEGTTQTITIDGTSMYTMANGNMLTGVQTAPFDYEVQGPIESNQLVNGPIHVDYDSGIYIDLKPDFEVTLGTSFHAFIDGCGGQ